MEKKSPAAKIADALSRRRFLKAGGVVLAGSALASCKRAPVPDATGVTDEPRIRRYRTLGRTGFQVSDVSLGGLPENGNVVRYAYDHGINLFDNVKDRDLTFNLGIEEISEEFVIKQTAKAGQKFPYSAYCFKGNDFAEGGSSPKIIIED